MRAESTFACRKLTGKIIKLNQMQVVLQTPRSPQRIQVGFYNLTFKVFRVKKFLTEATMNRKRDPQNLLLKGMVRANCIKKQILFFLQVWTFLALEKLFGGFVIVQIVVKLS